MRSKHGDDTTPSGSLVSPATIIIVCALGLTFLGLTILFSASAWFKKGPYFYLNKQLIGVVAAGVICFVVSRLNLDYVRRYAWWIGGGCVLLLALVLLVGVDVNGSRRWLGYGSVRLQVSEFAKLGLVFCLAHYLALNQTRIGNAMPALFTVLYIGITWYCQSAFGA
jgi:cell division protein FtsW